MKAEYLDILTEKGSLTDLFASLMRRSPVVTCLTQGKGPVDSYERDVLDIQPRIFAHIREITMGTTNTNWLFARTVIPTTTLRGKAARLKQMGNTPLGKILFGSLNAVRVEMQIDRVFADEVGLETTNNNADFLLWQRCSIFELSSGPLMITEILLPDCPIYETTEQN